MKTPENVELKNDLSAPLAAEPAMTPPPFHAGDAEPEAATIPWRRIICKCCANEGDTEAGFKITPAPGHPERVTATCARCGAANLIKRVRFA